MTKLSVAIITFNEEKNIYDCIQSIHDLADEVIVLDSFSTDRTKEIACSFPKVRFYTHPFYGHVEQKNKALEYCKNDWVLSLDADERADSELRDAIIRWKETYSKENCPFHGYKIARLTWHMGRFIRHSGWYPKRRYRLFHKSYATWVGENPHDEIAIRGKGTVLPGNIIHFSFTDYTAQIDTVNRFSSIVSYTRYKKGSKFNWFLCIVKPIFKFWEVYLFRLGFLDGFPGFAIACATSFSTYLKYAKIYELDKGYILKPSNLPKYYGEKNNGMQSTIGSGKIKSSCNYKKKQRKKG